MENFLKTNKFFSGIAQHKMILLYVTFFILVAWTSLSQSVWLDESLSIGFAKRSIREIINVAVKTDLHPPLYYLWLHISHFVLPQSIFIDRIWSAVFYIISGIIIARYVAGKTEEKGRVSFLASLFFLMSPFAVFYASEARSYAAVILISVIQFVYFTKMIERNTKKDSIYYVISSVIGVYLFYPLIFSLIAQFIYVCIEKRDKFKVFFISWCAIGIAYLPWIYFVLIHRLDTAPGHFLQIPWWQIPAVIFVGFSGGRTAITDINHVHWYWPTIVISMAYAVQFVGLYFWWKGEGGKQFLKLFAYLLFIPLGLCLLISATRFSVFDPRYYAQLFFIFIIALVFSNIQLRNFSKKTWVMSTAFFIMANCLFLGLYMLNPWFVREPWKQVVPEVERQFKPEDALLFIGCGEIFPPYTAYKTQDVKIISSNGDCNSGIDTTIEIEEHLAQEIGQVKRVWLSQYLEWQTDPRHEVRAFIERNFKYIETRGFFKVQFDLYERK